VFALIRFRHEHADVPIDDLLRAIAEQRLAGRIEHLHRADGVDQDDPVNGRFDERAQAPLALAQALLRLLALADVADDPGEHRTTVALGFSDGQLHREDRAVLALPGDLAPDADDPAFASMPVPAEIDIVLRLVGLRHEHLDVLPQHLVCSVAEQRLAGRVEHLHETERVDQDNAVDRSFDHGPEPALAFPQLLFGGAPVARPAAVASSEKPHMCSSASQLPDWSHLAP